MMPDNTLSTLQQIQTKVRRLTRSPSATQLTTQQLDDYINTFILYDMPRHLQLFDLKTTLTFYLSNNIDIYQSVTTPNTHPLYNFINQYTNVLPPAYVDGREIYYTQSREEFYQNYPLTNYTQQLAVGDDVTLIFSGTITTRPILQNQLTLTSIDLNNEALSAYDLPTDTDFGALLFSTTQVPIGTINYLTGAYTITWPTAPGDGKSITAHYYNYVAGRPNSVLFYNNQFTFRPVPDQPYRFTIDAAVRPTELLNTSQQPELSQWWQYIAYGAAKKVFEDRLDLDSVQLITPEFMQQEILVNRKTILLQINNRAATLYSGQTEQLYGPFGNFNT
jgi:hypothetical protein